MSMEWFRWYDNTVTDPKLALIAKKSGQSRPVVIAVWAALLEQASRADQRGDLTRFDLVHNPRNILDNRGSLT